MSLIQKGPDDVRYGPTLQTVARQLLRGRCVLFLGAGASISRVGPSLPSGQELSRLLAEACRLDWHDYIPLSTIAFYYESFFTRQGLNDLLVEKIDQEGPWKRGEEDKIPPSRTVTQLMEIINVLEARKTSTLTITTNYDRHFETAYENRFKRLPEVVVYRGGWNPNDRIAKLHYTSTGEPISGWLPTSLTHLYKMHGCISQAQDQSLVITEEDYINFLSNALGERQDNQILYYVRYKLETSTILFLGYSLADWNFRTIFKATVERRENKDMRSYAVQLRQPARPGERDLHPLMVDFWHDKRVDIINIVAEDFVSDLLEAVEAEVMKEGMSVGVGRP
jgi:hypothetical protein